MLCNIAVDVETEGINQWKWLCREHSPTPSTTETLL